ncbi:MAG: hypothetical protein ABIW76_16285 [Fibrobacteria bacterium]
MKNRCINLLTSALLGFVPALSVLLVACLGLDSRQEGPGKLVAPSDSGGPAIAQKSSVYMNHGAPDTVTWDSAWSPNFDSLGNQTGYFRLAFMGSDLLLKWRNSTWLAKGSCGGWSTDFHYVVAGPGQSLFEVNEPCEGIRRLDRWRLLPVDQVRVYEGGPCAPDKTLAFDRHCLILQDGSRRLKISSDMDYGGNSRHRLLIGREMSLQEIQDPPSDSLITATGLRASIDLSEAPSVVSGGGAGAGGDTLREVNFQGAHLRFRFTPSQAAFGGVGTDSVVLAPGQALFRAVMSCENYGVWDPADMVRVPGYRIRDFDAGGRERAGLDRYRECLIFQDENIHVKISPWMHYSVNLPIQMLDLELMARPR